MTVYWLLVTVKMVKSADNTARGFLVKKNNHANGQDVNGGLILNHVNQSVIFCKFGFLAPQGALYPVNSLTH